MIKKRGQVTVFIILGILIFIMMIVSLSVWKNYLQSDLKTEAGERIIETEQVRIFVESCLMEKTKDGLEFNLQQGGYYNDPGIYVDFSIYKIPYFFDQSILDVPSEEEIEEELSGYIENNLKPCFDNLNILKINFTMEGNPEVTVDITNELLLVNLKQVIIVRENNKEKTIRSFKINIPGRLHEMLNLRDEIIVEQEKFPNEIRTSKLVELSNNTDFRIRLVSFNNTLLYLLNEKNSAGNFENLSYVFAMKYGWD